jgi:hypothetical protein
MRSRMVRMELVRLLVVSLNFHGVRVLSTSLGIKGLLERTNRLGCKYGKIA